MNFHKSQILVTDKSDLRDKMYNNLYKYARGYASSKTPLDAKWRQK